MARPDHSSSSPSSSSSSDTAVEDVLPSSSGSPRLQLRRNVRTALVYLSPVTWFFVVVRYMYEIYQIIVSALFTKKYRPLPDGVEPLGRVAIVGAGLSGIASAAHLVAHGFDVVIYDSSERIGGIWANVNSTSSLQLNSILYRFHPSVRWSKGFPSQPEIVGEIEKLSDRYELGPRTRLNTKVTKIVRDEASSTDPNEHGHARWIVNDGQDGIFDAVIATIGTCGKPKMVEFKGQESFKGKIVHSSKLDDVELRGKKVVVVGSGASGVEASELAVSKHASSITLLARDDKWIIPRSTLFDVALSLQPFGREMPLSFIPEWFIRLFHYRDLINLSPRKKGLFQGTPIVNDEFLAHIRQGKIVYRRGDTKALTSTGVRFNERDRKSQKGDKGVDTVETADVIVLATGFERPSVDFLPEDLFPKEGPNDYGRPNLYIQNFTVNDCSVLLTNASYMDAIGTVGNWHIGIYTRLLILFLVKKDARPLPSAMRLWVNMLTFIKVTCFGENGTSGLAFFTYMELLLWVFAFHFFKLARLPYMPFVLFGWGGPSSPKSRVVKNRGSLRDL